MFWLQTTVLLLLYVATLPIIFLMLSLLATILRMAHGGAKPIDFQREVDLKIIPAGDFNEAKSLEAFRI